MLPTLRTTALRSSLLLLHTQYDYTSTPMWVKSQACTQNTHRHSYRDKHSIIQTSQHGHTKNETREQLPALTPSTHFTDAHGQADLHTPHTADTHHTNAHPPVPPPVPSSMLGLVQARNHPPRETPTTAAPPLSRSILR